MRATLLPPSILWLHNRVVIVVWAHYCADRLSVCKGPHGPLLSNSKQLPTLFTEGCQNLLWNINHWNTAPFVSSDLLHRHGGKKKTTAPVEVTFITSSSRRRIAASCSSPAKRPSTSRKANCNVTPEPVFCRQGHSLLDHACASSVAEEIMWKHINIYSEQSSLSITRFSENCNKTNRPTNKKNSSYLIAETLPCLTSDSKPK